MKLMTPGPQRWTMRESARGVEFSFPPQRRWFIVAFLLVWLGGWTFGEISVIRALLAPSVEGIWYEKIFLLVWLSGWTFGGGIALYAVLWIILGVERVTVGRGILAVKRDLLGFGRKRGYRLDQISNLRVENMTYNPSNPKTAMAFWGMGGPVAFDFGSDTVHFGAGLTEVDANKVVAQISART